MIREHVDLAPLTTFHVPARARYFAEVPDLETLRTLVAGEPFRRGPVLFLGGGSNVLFTADFPGLVLRLGLRGRAVEREDGEAVLVRLACGEDWPSFAAWSLEQGLGGVENLSGIPGTAGAAPVQNIGAYGAELADTLVEVAAWDPCEGRVVTLPAADCRLGYRSSVFKGDLAGRRVILSVLLRLSRRPVLRLDYGPLRAELAAMGVSAPGVREVGAAVLRIRGAKLPDPAVTGSAGSFFQNPAVGPAQAGALRGAHPGIPLYPLENGGFKIAAGWLIEQAGWKGFRRGDAGVHDRQALVLVNHGRATGAQVLALAREIQASVEEKFAVRLEPEVRIV